MKQIRFIAIIAAAAALSVACAKEMGSPELGEGTEMTITASFAENKTKTTLQDGGTSVYWEAGDDIKLFYDGAGGRFTNQYSELSGTAKFSGSLNVVFGSNEGFSDSTPLWGLYPYRADATADNASVTTTLPAEQTGKAGSFAKGMNLSLAKSTSLAMGFYNVCGGVRFSVTRDDVTDVVFEALNGESVAGKVKLAFESGVPVVQEVVEGVDSIVLTAPAGGAFEVGKWYYIVALPGTLSGGFKMTFNTDTKYAILESSGSKTIKRSSFGQLADADSGLLYKDKGTPEPTGDYIVFKDPIAKIACIYAKYDTDNDGEISYDEAAAVTSISGLFSSFNTVTSFDELKYFTGISNMSSALKGLTGLKSVTIPAQLTALENYAFDGCTVLDSLTFAGNNVKSVGQYAFRNCSALPEITLPSAVVSIGQYAFQSCSHLSSVQLSSSLNTIGQYSFNGCSALTAIEIPSGVTAVNRYTFQNCSSLAAVDIPSGVTSIGEYAFSGCSVLTSVDFPSALKTIGNYAFQNCKAIKSVSVPSAVTSFGNNVFNGCSSLESAVLPSGLASIPEGTFSGCPMLNQFSFPECATSIGNSAFSGCYFVKNKVSKIQLPTTITSIGSSAFTRVLNVLIPSSSPVSISSGAFGDYTKIYVNSSLVGVYKVMTNWSDYADRIFSINDYEDPDPSGPTPEGAVDMGLSVYWATCNIGATNPEDYGRYFAWGDVVGQTWNGSSWSGGGFSSYPSYELDENNNLKPEYDAAHVNLGGNWRMPTHSEQQEMIDLCEWTWTQKNGVNGREVKSRINGNTIFLPAAGYGFRSELYGAGSDGYYWSSTFDYDILAWSLFFYSDYVSTYRSYRYLGQSVRPVTE